MTPRALVRLAPLAAAALLAACAHGRSREPADGTGRRALVVNGHGRRVVAIPAGWRATESAEGAAPGPTVKLEKPGEKFVVLLTPLWNPGEPEPPQARADTARLFAELGRRSALAGSVEQDIPLEELEGPAVRGAYFSATDSTLVGRETGPGEYRHVLQGAAAVGPVILAFTVLDDEPGPWRDQALELVRGARHVADGEPEAGPPGDLEPVPEEETAPLRLRWPGRSWALLVDLPGFRVGLRPAAAGPPYAIGLHPDSGIAASVALVDAAGARDASGCRIAIARSEAPGTARATYEIAEGKGGVPETHAHAFLFLDGTCATVHVSRVGPEPGDAARLEEILSSARFAEDF